MVKRVRVEKKAIRGRESLMTLVPSRMIDMPTIRIAMRLVLPPWIGG
jgi:hypothetical protein